MTVMEFAVVILVTLIVILTAVNAADLCESYLLT